MVFVGYLQTWMFHHVTASETRIRAHLDRHLACAFIKASADSEWCHSGFHTALCRCPENCLRHRNRTTKPFDFRNPQAICFEHRELSA